MFINALALLVGRILVF